MTTTLRSKAFACLAHREHSAFELSQKLKAFAEEEVLAEQVVSELIEEGYCDDSRFAEVYIRSRSRQGFGPFKITMELKERQVAGEIIEEKIAEIDWLEILRILWVKKVSREDYQDNTVLQKKMRFFATKGFSHDSIRSIMREFLSEIT